MDTNKIYTEHPRAKLVDIDGHQLFVEVVPCLRPEGYKTVRFTTYFQRSNRHAKDDMEQYHVTLSPEALQTLIDTISK
jgi:hypothetical protein